MDQADKAAILSTGDELITGRVVDTNSSYIADKLFSLGVEVVAFLKVGDDKERLLWALHHAMDLADLIIGIGGLGPTADDLTSETVTEFLGQELEFHEDIAEALKRRFEARGRPWTANNLKQAKFPKGAELLPNPQGTAPGFRIWAGEGKWLIWLSGVPEEMRETMQKDIIPWLVQEKRTKEIATSTFKIHGLTESELDDILKPVHLPEGGKISFRAHDNDFSLRLMLRGVSKDNRQFQDLKARIGELLQPYTYGEGDETLEEIVGRLLRKNQWTLALAESCTGGYISHRITRVPGSSDYFTTSAVTYSNEAKRILLGVKRSTLDRHGAVSSETALEMAQGIKKKARASIALSVTGVAGPTGGSSATPVGTVWMAMAEPQGNKIRSFHFEGDREGVIRSAAQAALHWLREILLQSK